MNSFIVAVSIATGVAFYVMKDVDGQWIQVATQARATTFRTKESASRRARTLRRQLPPGIWTLEVVSP
jgi:hypothetical protein